MVIYHQTTPRCAPRLHIQTHERSESSLLVYLIRQTKKRYRQEKKTVVIYPQNPCECPYDSLKTSAQNKHTKTNQRVPLRKWIYYKAYNTQSVFIISTRKMLCIYIYSAQYSLQKRECMNICVIWVALFFVVVRVCRPRTSKPNEIIYMCRVWCFVWQKHVFFAVGTLCQKAIFMICTSQTTLQETI